MPDSNSQNTKEAFTLYHHWACPKSRRVRLHLAECGVAFNLVTEFPWNRRIDFLRINPAGQVPVLTHKNGFVISSAYAISEYLEDKMLKGLFGSTPEEGTEIRRLMQWFDKKFYDDVFHHIVHEKMVKTLMKKGSPDSQALKAGYSNLEFHLDYCEWLLERRKLLAGSFLSMADFTAAAHLSCLDYLGCIEWDNYQALREWYMRLKSRPCFRNLLQDNIPAVPVSKHYRDLDF